jgi:hypothetical protein
MPANLIFVIIGTAFGVKRRNDGLHLRTYPAQHLLYHMIAPYQDTVYFDSRRAMTVAEMPGDPVQIMRRCTSDLNQILCGGLNSNPATIVQRKAIAISERRRLFEIE